MTTAKKPKYQEVLIPFIPTDSLIFVNAIIGHGIYPCIIDTGTSVITWPALLNINSYPCSSNSNANLSYGDDSPSIPGDCRVIPTILTGGLVFHRMPTVRYFQDHVNVGNNIVTLGNQAFANLVLTIDYPKRELIVRTHQYNFTNAQYSSGSQILPFTIIDGVPIVAGQVNHHPTRFMLDTGATNCLLTTAFCRRYRLQQQQGQGTITTTFVRAAHDSIIKDAEISLSAVQWKATNIDVEKSIDAHADGSLGVPLLKQYRITIDYSRRKLLLEPYAR